MRDNCSHCGKDRIMYALYDGRYICKDCFDTVDKWSKGKGTTE